MFLTELLLALAIFALCSSVCAGLFAWSHRISDQSNALSHAVVAAQSGAEAFKKHASPEGVAAVLGGVAQADGCTVYFDAEWLAAGSEGAAFVMRIQMSQAAGLRQAAIIVSDSQGGEVYRIDASAMPAEERP